MNRLLSVVMVVLCMALWGQRADALTAYVPDANTVGLWHLDEGAGTTARDSSGNANHGTISGGPVWDPVTGSCLLFTGAGGVRIPDSASLDVVTAVTVEAWINVDQAVDYGYIFTKRDDMDLYTVISSGKLYIRFGVSTTGWDSVTGPELKIGQWYHVAGTFDGTTLRIYVDGVLAQQQAHKLPGTIYVNTDNAEIGNWYSPSSSNAFKGYIDEVRVSKVARTLSELGPNYVPPAPTPGVSEQRVNELIGDAIEDAMVDVGDMIEDAVSEKADLTHGHQIADISGLAGELADRVTDRVYNAHVHDKGSGGRNTSVPNPQAP